MKKLQFKRPSKRAFIALFFIVWALFGAVNLAFPLIASAGDEGWYTTDSMRKADNILAPEIYGATAAGSGDLSGFGEGTTKIGFDTLYGTTQRDTTYTGEVPNSKYNESLKDYPHFLFEQIDARWRMWQKKPEGLLSGTQNGDQPDNDLSWKDGKTKDLHAYLLVSHSNVGVFDGLLKGLGGISFAVASAINAPVSWILRLFISFANFDVNTLANQLDLDDLAKTISNLFTIDSNGNISPVLVVALAVFMIGLAGLIVRRITGSGSAHELGKEIVMLVLAFVLIGVSFIGGQGGEGGYRGLITSMGTLTTRLTEGISGSDSDAIELFQYNTDDANADLNSYMGGLTAKGYIDAVIQSQFGYPVDELELWNDNNAQASVDNWGITTDDMKTIVRNIGGETGDQNLFAVSTGANGTITNSEAPNIGYWWYAVTSGIDPSNPFEVSSDGKIITHKCDPKQGVFIMDLMAAIHAKTSADPSSIGYIKSEKIVETFYSHDWRWAEMFAQVFVTAALVWAIFFLALASFVFKIIFNIGFIVIPILPILLLIKKTRDMARKLLFSWVSAAIIFMLCLICMCAVLFTSASLSSAGFVGILVDLALLVGTAFAAPRLVQALMSVPKKMGLEMAAPMNSAMHWGNEQLSKMNQKNPARLAAMDKMRQLDRKETHTNSSDMTGFGGGEAAYSNEANAAMLSNTSGYDDDINKLSKREWEAVQNNTAKDFAEISEMKDSEALRQPGASEALISAVQKKEEKQESIAKKREEIRQKRMKFYQGLQDNKLARVAGYTRIGNHMMNGAMKLGESGRKWQERLDPRFHGSGLNRSDRKVLNQARKSGEYDTGAAAQRAKLKQKAVQEHMNKGRIHAQKKEQREQQERHEIMEKAAKKHVAKLAKRSKE